MAGAVSARLPYRGRAPMGPPSAPPAAVAGNGAQALPRVVARCRVLLRDGLPWVSRSAPALGHEMRVWPAWLPPQASAANTPGAPLPIR